jgi:hypothetical protein
MPPPISQGDNISEGRQVPAYRSRATNKKFWSLMLNSQLFILNLSFRKRYNEADRFWCRTDHLNWSKKLLRWVLWVTSGFLRNSCHRRCGGAQPNLPIMYFPMLPNGCLTRYLVPPSLKTYEARFFDLSNNVRTCHAWAEAIHKLPRLSCGDRFQFPPSRHCTFGHCTVCRNHVRKELHHFKT